MKNQNNLNKDRIYYLSCCVFVGILAFLFAFPLYWIITGSFKTGAEINSTVPVWIQYRGNANRKAIMPTKMQLLM